MCTIDKVPVFNDTVYGTTSMDELLGIIYDMPDHDLMKLKLVQLKEIAINLGLSGIKSILTKDKVLSKIKLGIKAQAPIDYYDIPNYTYLLFDTETTLGFGTGRLLQLGVKVYKGQTLVYEYSSYVLPCGFDVTGTEIHGIDTNIAYSLGKPILSVITKFIDIIESMDVDIIVAHNLPFDKDVLQRESIMLDMKLFTDEYGPGTIKRTLRSIDTCRTPSILTYVQVHKSLPRAVFPSLGDLYHVCTGTDMVVKHTAMDDVGMLAECLFRLIRMGIITDDQYKYV